MLYVSGRYQYQPMTPLHLLPHTRIPAKDPSPTTTPKTSTQLSLRAESFAKKCEQYVMSSAVYHSKNKSYSLTVARSDREDNAYNCCSSQCARTQITMARCAEVEDKMKKSSQQDNSLSDCCNYVTTSDEQLNSKSSDMFVNDVNQRANLSYCDLYPLETTV